MIGQISVDLRMIIRHQAHPLLGKGTTGFAHFRNRRFTRLNTAFSTKFENHDQMLAIHAVRYNFLGIHKTLKVTPAMEAGICDTLLKWEELLTIFDAEAP